MLAPDYQLLLFGASMSLNVGDAAPDFELSAVTGERTHSAQLRDYRGRQNVVITFHPLDWTPT
jgi:peroxiredoxin